MAALALGGVLAAHAAAGGDDEAFKKELKRLEGDWQCTREEGSANLTPEIILKGLRLTIEGNRYQTIWGGKSLGGAATILKLDPKANPMTIDVEWISGATKGQKQLGIYKLIGDKLEVCWGEESSAKRPTKFTTKPGIGAGKLYVVYQRDKGEEGGAAPPPPAVGPKKGAGPAGLGKPDLVVTPAEWRADFKKDAAAAKAKYRGKVIEMSGTVDSVRPEPFGAPFAYMNFEVKDDLLGVRCVLTDTKPWRKVSPGSKVKVRGKSSEVQAGDLNPCEIIEAGPNPVVVMTAGQLAKEFAADRVAAQKKYEDKWAIITGEVVARGKSEFCAVRITLKGDADITMTCCFGEAYKRSAEAVKVGAQVEIFGKLAIYAGPKETTIPLDICVLSEVK
jgi:uncharacterized protein (TIGR03067 family)